MTNLGRSRVINTHLLAPFLAKVVRPTACRTAAATEQSEGAVGWSE